MKKFSKLFLSCAAVAAVTAAVATSAMAAGISATYAPADATHETATLTIDASGYTAAQKTLLVLKPGKTLETVIHSLHGWRRSGLFNKLQSR